MTGRQQKYLALGGVVAFVTLVLGANAHLLIAAFHSQPACVRVEGAGIPAHHAC